MAVDVQTEIVIGVPRDVVAEYTIDPSRAPEWYANIESVEWKTPPPLADHAHRRRPVPMETTNTFTAHGSTGTHMTLRNRGEPKGFSAISAPLMAAAMRRPTARTWLL
ncbi:hypothetical protein [Amycolatopsis sp. NPDC051102]|uniref:hypothetical protein n=1 Tax=Amycolatopsis sp. NPDC051102 TaxID=3155163 RepID=UPI003412C085